MNPFYFSSLTSGRGCYFLYCFHAKSFVEIPPFTTHKSFICFLILSAAHFQRSVFHSVENARLLIYCRTFIQKEN